MSHLFSLTDLCLPSVQWSRGNGNSRAGGSDHLHPSNDILHGQGESMKSVFSVTSIRIDVRIQVLEIATFC